MSAVPLFVHRRSVIRRPFLTRQQQSAPMDSGPGRELRGGPVGPAGAARAWALPRAPAEFGDTCLTRTAADRRRGRIWPSRSPQKKLQEKRKKRKTYINVNRLSWQVFSPGSAVNFDPGLRYRLFTVFGVHV